jgi:hypothetical protein
MVLYLLPSKLVALRQKSDAIVAPRSYVQRPGSGCAIRTGIRVKHVHASRSLIMLVLIQGYKYIIFA